jgi:hypothetical protein
MFDEVAASTKIQAPTTSDNSDNRFFKALQKQQMNQT